MWSINGKYSKCKVSSSFLFSFHRIVASFSSRFHFHYFHWFSISIDSVLYLIIISWLHLLNYSVNLVKKLILIGWFSFVYFLVSSVNGLILELISCYHLITFQLWLCRLMKNQRMIWTKRFDYLKISKRSEKQLLMTKRWLWILIGEGTKIGKL